MIERTNIGIAADAAAAAVFRLHARQSADMMANMNNGPGRNESAIALSYGFIDYFDDRSFGSGKLSQAAGVAPSRFGSSSQLATATPIIVTLGIAALVLRIFSRTRFNAKFWWDDLFAVLAGLLLTASQLIFIRIVYLGQASLDTMLQTARQWEQERMTRISLGLKLYMSFELLYIFSSFFVKYSFLFLYLKISQETKSIKWYLRGAFLVTTLAFGFCVLALFLTCMPVSDFWNIWNSQPSCERKMLLTFGTGVSNIITDTIVLAILIPLLLQASLCKAQIRGVICLYACGALVIVASGLRFATQLMDVSMLQSMGWSLLEVSLALILLCAPMCAKILGAPLLQEVGPPVTSKRNRNFDRRYSSSPFDKNLPAPPPVMAGAKVRKGSRTERLVKEMKEMSSPMYRRLKVGRRESATGRTVWEVQPQSATTQTAEMVPVVPPWTPVDAPLRPRQLGEPPLPPLPRRALSIPIRV
ncbi:hypothetical protein DRE_00318 [Drechslerella stenobrocha 248]|uniref:Rhodopsin domain-containing protein n=1 Tax=Drechslerella stenobrocha 248 TaxID=1043628 RepID=W7IE99_9PEZI|nr:hypothetical protein DRE_00318 [Drechslerella stenobrocha 248]